MYYLMVFLYVLLAVAGTLHPCMTNSPDYCTAFCWSPDRSY